MLYLVTPPANCTPVSISSITNISLASAIKHLTEKERKKLMQDPGYDKRQQTFLSDDEMIGKLIDTGQVLILFAVSSLSTWGPMF